MYIGGGGRADVEAKATAKPTPEMSSSSPSGGFFKFFIFPFRPERKFFFCSGGGRRWIIFPYDQLSGSREKNKIEMCCSRTPPNFDRLFLFFFWLRHLICPRLGHAGHPKVYSPHLRQIVAPCLVLLVIFFLLFVVAIFLPALFCVCVCVCRYRVLIASARFFPGYGSPEFFLLHSICWSIHSNWGLPLFLLRHSRKNSAVMKQKTGFIFHPLLLSSQ
jgi:hypothetical protein